VGTYVLGDGDGAPIAGPNGETVSRLGLNVPAVAETLRKFALTDVPTGAAHLRWQSGATGEGFFLAKPTLVLY
jgi:hypothetical protein